LARESQILRGLSCDSGVAESIPPCFDVCTSVSGEEGAGNAKDRLLVAADLFRSSPYVEVGVAQILSKAGVKPPTLYHHYGDKEGLFLAWGLKIVRLLGDDILRRKAGQSSVRDLLMAIGSSLASPSYPSLMMILRDINHLDRASSREQLVEAIHRAVYEPLIEVLVMEMAAGRIRRDPVHKTLAAFVHLADSLRVGGMLSIQEEPDNLPYVVDRFLHGFSSPFSGA